MIIIFTDMETESGLFPFEEISGKVDLVVKAGRVCSIFLASSGTLSCSAEDSLV